MSESWNSLVDPDDEVLRQLLGEARTIAVVGMKPDPAAAAFLIPQYLQNAGYRIIPVNPGYPRAMGIECVASLDDIRVPVDIVDLFRASEHIPAHAQQALELRPRLFWMQLGIRHPDSAERLARAGITVVQDRCLMVEHTRLLPLGPQRG